MSHTGRSPLTRARALGLALIVALVASYGFACQTFRGASPETRWFEAKQGYALVLEIVVAYAESPAASQRIVRNLAAANQQAQALLFQGDALLAAAKSDTRDEALDTTARLLVQLSEALRAYLTQAAAAEGGTP